MMARQRTHDMEKKPLDASMMTFDIATLLEEIKREKAWQTGDRNAMTLLKGQGLRVLLVALHGGATIPSHQTDSPISLQVIEGSLSFGSGTQAATLRKGELLTLEGGVPHTVEALEESAFLLTLATDRPHPTEGSGQ